LSFIKQYSYEWTEQDFATACTNYKFYC